MIPTDSNDERSAMKTRVTECTWLCTPCDGWTSKHSNYARLRARHLECAYLCLSFLINGLLVFITLLHKAACAAQGASSAPPAQLPAGQGQRQPRGTIATIAAGEGVAGLEETEAADFANYFYSYAELDHQKQMLEDDRFVGCRCLKVCFFSSRLTLKQLVRLPKVSQLCYPVLCESCDDPLSRMIDVFFDLL